MQAARSEAECLIVEVCEEGSVYEGKSRCDDSGDGVESEGGLRCTVFRSDGSAEFSRL